jgi:alkylation response protein AidB-like acyl-CoA dehydrogenase
VSTSGSPALVEEFRAWLRAHAAELAAFTRRVPVEIEKQVEHERVLQRMLWDAGWLRRGWPESSGGSGGSALDRGALYDALWQAGYLVPESMAAVEVIGPAVVTYAPHLACTLLPAYLRGDEIWCQGFSEPDSGSDLASLRTRIEERDGSLRITGQKIWASHGSFSDRCLLLGRSGAPSSGHRGLSMILVDLDQPGVETRPIRAASGRNEFAEIFFDDAEASSDRLLGQSGDGWAIAMSLLQWERGMYAWQRQAYLHARMDEILRESRLPVDAASVGRVYAGLCALRLKCRGTLRALAAGEAPGPDISIDKLLLSAAEQSVLDLAATALGPDFAFGDDELSAEIRDEWFYSRATSIYGGAAEIQRNIIAERVLRLPKESSVGRR